MQGVFLERFFRVRQIATCYINGPRSVMFPEDPDGLKLWLEPVVRLTVNFRVPLQSRSLAIFCVPNCIEHDSSSPVLVRNAHWDGHADREACKQGEVSRPSVVTVYKSVSPEEVVALDELLRKLDESLSGFQFAVEGLDLDRPSGFKVLPEDAVITTGTSHNKLSRITRFQHVQLSWTPNQAEFSPVDHCWNSLF